MIKYQDEAHDFNASWHYEPPARAYFWGNYNDRREGFTRVMILTNLSPENATKLFGPRAQTFKDSDGRRLSCWRLEHGGRPFWLFAHNGRGSSLEIHSDATPQECLETFQWLEQQVTDAGLAPNLPEVQSNGE